MPHIAIISTSMADKSRSRLAAKLMHDKAKEIDGLEVTWFDVAENPMTMYKDGTEDDNVKKGKDVLKHADAWIIAGPVHNWGPASSTINFLSYCLDRKSYSYKPFTLLAGAGSGTSLLAFGGLSQTIKTEVKGVEVGPAILCAGDSVDRDSGAIEDKLKERLEDRFKELVRFAKA